MNYTTLDIIHFWADSRAELIRSVLPSKGKVFVYSAVDLSGEAGKVCGFITLVVKQPWTFRVDKENDLFVIVFLPETVTLKNLF
jgi:hypothetical protein